MSHEAEIAVNEALNFEGKLDALRRNQDGVVKLTLTVHPNDFPQRLMTDPFGQRYVCVMVALNDDDTPKVSALAAEKGRGDELVRPPKTYGQRASALAAVRDFQIYTQSADMAEAKAAIRLVCRVESCAQIDESKEAQTLFEQLADGFKIWSQERQRGRG